MSLPLQRKQFHFQVGGHPRCYRLLEKNAHSVAIQAAFYDAVSEQTAVAPEHRERFLNTCESLANAHVSGSCCCLGAHHMEIPFPVDAFGALPRPYSYIGSHYHTWPYSVMKESLFVFCPSNTGLNGTHSRKQCRTPVDPQLVCELCKIDLPSRKDCGLKDAFLTLELRCI